jgi:16S rRNA (cytidine1402-2'-O)-methyltransferase
VVAAIERGVTVVPIPGATAVINALVASGLPSARFVFEGFLPRTKKSRIEKLVELASEPRTVIYYESPERLSVTLSELSHACGDSRRACVARELTKVFEEFRRGELSELRDHYAAEKARGECVIVVEGAPQNDHVDDVGADENDTPDQTNDLIKRLATATGINRQDIYRAIAELKRSSG